MKIIPLLAGALFLAVAGQAQTPFQQRPQPLPPPGVPRPFAVPQREPANYLIRVEWKDPKGETKSLEALTTEGHFELDTIQKNSVKINNNDVPVTLKFSGSLNAINDEKGRLQLFLGRTVPYVTSTNSSGSSSYSQMNVGLDSAVIVHFGKAEVIQNDENGQITVLVKRVED